MNRTKAQRKICGARGCSTPWRSAKTRRCYRHRDNDQGKRVLMPKECTVGRCLNVVLKRGRCSSHQYADYCQLRPEALDLIEIGLMRWIVPSDAGCWLYVNEAMHDGNGYGKFRPDGRWAQVHRWLYMHLVGAIPDGYQMHHECNVRNCCRPGHLTPVTPEEHAKLTASNIEFGRMFPGVKKAAPDLSHTDRERNFAAVFNLPAESNIPRLERITTLVALPDQVDT